MYDKAQKCMNDLHVWKRLYKMFCFQSKGVYKKCKIAQIFNNFAVAKTDVMFVSKQKSIGSIHILALVFSVKKS